MKPTLVRDIIGVLIDENPNIHFKIRYDKSGFSSLLKDYDCMKFHNTDLDDACEGYAFMSENGDDLAIWLGDIKKITIESECIVEILIDAERAFEDTTDFNPMKRK